MDGDEGGVLRETNKMDCRGREELRSGGVSVAEALSCPLHGPQPARRYSPTAQPLQDHSVLNSKRVVTSRNQYAVRRHANSALILRRRPPVSNCLLSGQSIFHQTYICHTWTSKCVIICEKATNREQIQVNGQMYLTNQRSRLEAENYSNLRANGNDCFLFYFGHTFDQFTN